MYTTRTGCRICGGELETVLNLGEIFPSNFLAWGMSTEKAPLELVKCTDCGLVQLRDTVELDEMYKQYWYLSGLNPSMVAALQDVVNCANNLVRLKPGDTIVDIGSNDGTMLGMFPDSLFKVGFEPAVNITEGLPNLCDIFVNDYFPSSLYEVKDAMLITAIAMFYDLENPKEFIKYVKKALHPEGLFIIQFTDLLSMLDMTAFDNICHEHLEYYTVEVVNNLLEEFGLEIFDLEYNSVNGSSVRIYASHKGYRPVNEIVMDTLKYEQHKLESGVLSEFVSSIEEAKTTLVDYLSKLPKPIAVLGASTKGNTLLQYFGLDNSIINHAAEINKEKYGLHTVGTEIPIIPEDKSLESQPSAYLVLPWHFIEVFIKKFDDYLNKGGKLIVPLPKPLIHYKEGGVNKWELL